MNNFECGHDTVRIPEELPRLESPARYLPLSRTLYLPFNIPFLSFFMGVNEGENDK